MRSRNHGFGVSDGGGYAGPPEVEPFILYVDNWRIDLLANHRDLQHVEHRRLGHPAEKRKVPAIILRLDLYSHVDRLRGVFTFEPLRPGHRAMPGLVDGFFQIL